MADRNENAPESPQGRVARIKAMVRAKSLQDATPRDYSPYAGMTHALIEARQRTHAESPQPATETDLPRKEVQS